MAVGGLYLQAGISEVDVQGVGVVYHVDHVNHVGKRGRYAVAVSDGVAVSRTAALALAVEEILYHCVPDRAYRQCGIAFG